MRFPQEGDYYVVTRTYTWKLGGQDVTNEEGAIIGPLGHVPLSGGNRLLVDAFCAGHLRLLTRFDRIDKPLVDGEIGAD